MENPRRCRVCLKNQNKENLISLSEKNINGLSVIELIEFSSGIRISVDQHSPTEICNVCLRGFSIASQLKKILIASEQKLKIEMESSQEALEYDENGEGQFELISMDSIKFDDSEVISISSDSSNESSSEENSNSLNCRDCLKNFQSSKELSRHVQLYHTTAHDTFKCNICFKTYTTKRKYKKHKKIRHSEQHKFKCCYCDKEGFGSSKFLKYHQKKCKTRKFLQ
jgi:hypothetical protein